MNRLKTTLASVCVLTGMSCGGVESDSCSGIAELQGLRLGMTRFSARWIPGVHVADHNPELLNRDVAEGSRLGAVQIGFEDGRADEITASQHYSEAETERLLATAEAVRIDVTRALGSPDRVGLATAKFGREPAEYEIQVWHRECGSVVVMWNSSRDLEMAATERRHGAPRLLAVSLMTKAKSELHLLRYQTKWSCRNDLRGEQLQSARR